MGDEDVIPDLIVVVVCNSGGSGAVGVVTGAIIKRWQQKREIFLVTPSLRCNCNSLKCITLKHVHQVTDILIILSFRLNIHRYLDCTSMKQVQPTKQWIKMKWKCTVITWALTSRFKNVNVASSRWYDQIPPALSHPLITTCQSLFGWKEERTNKKSMF